MAFFIDLQKAFDTIDHNILLQKLDTCGIRGTSLMWLKSYLTNRQPFVQLEERKSTLTQILCGVPQGSILGPKQFLLYINDPRQLSKKLKTVLFADDTTRGNL